MTSIPIPRGRGMAVKDAPDHRDAELVLQLYGLRREATMREARRYMSAEFWPTSAADLIAITKPEHPGNGAYRQVTSYWEMAYAMARHGIVNPDYLAESAAEGLYVFAKFQPWLAELRAAGSPRTLLNAEWLATSCEVGREVAERFRKRVEAALAARRRK